MVGSSQRAKSDASKKTKKIGVLTVEEDSDDAPEEISASFSKSQFLEAKNFEKIARPKKKRKQKNRSNRTVSEIKTEGKEISAEILANLSERADAKRKRLESERTEPRKAKRPVAEPPQKNAPGENRKILNLDLVVLDDVKAKKEPNQKALSFLSHQFLRRKRVPIAKMNQKI
mmetsp:Transcript_11901/g.17755  ORF Transcript_11901/g.17755 Transcript_11901/m.17755 type:complete len:173 (-) Transcript_11901:113-631(-)